MAALTEWMAAADPGRVHTEGRMARVALEAAREHVALLFGTRARQVIFTSGATESVHAAIFGALARSSNGRHLVVPAVEHSCVREPSERAGPVTWVGVDAAGRVDVDEVVDAITPETALVHCQWANHEVGTLQPVAEVVAACRARGVLVHIDAAMAGGHVPIAFDDVGADLVSLSAHKMGGPRGMGALLVRRGLRIPPMFLGGAQERARRAGLEDVAAAVAWGNVAEALTGRPDDEPPDRPQDNRAQDNRPQDNRPQDNRPQDNPPGDGSLAAEAIRATAQTARLRQAALAIEGVVAYGPAAAADRLPHLVCVGIDGVEPEGVLLGLDQAGVAAHSGSACASEILEPSPVLAAMGAAAERSLRFSVGWSTTDDEIERAVAALPDVISRLRSLATSA